MFLRKHFLGGATGEELDDVVDNLLNVLTTRRGTGYFLDNFGTTDVGFRTPQEMVEGLTAEIKENVRLYEPRVELIEVEEDWNDAGKRTFLAVRMRMRERGEKLDIIVDLEKRKLDVVAR
jgi:hypothetical protein